MQRVFQALGTRRRPWLNLALAVLLAPLVLFAACDNLTGNGNKDEPVPVITITEHPADKSFAVGSVNGTLTVAATAEPSATLGYQWYRASSATNSGGTAISGANSASFTIPADLAVGVYYYYCVASASGADSRASNVAKVTVSAQSNGVITISVQPVDMQVTAGSITGSLTVTASATQNAPLQYQWYSNTSASNSGGTIIPGANSKDFTIPRDLTVTTWYYCVVSSEMAVEAKTSEAAKVEVSTTPVLNITSHPGGHDFIVGNISGSLSVQAQVTQGATITYQWYSNTSASNTGGTIISGANNESYSIPTDLPEGKTYYYCVVSAAGAQPASITSEVATVSVYPEGTTPSIIINAHPSSLIELTEGSISGSLTVSASVHPNFGQSLSYQWYFGLASQNKDDLEPLSGANGQRVDIPANLSIGEYQAYCRVSATGLESKDSNIAKMIIVKPAPADIVINLALDDLDYGDISMDAPEVVSANETVYFSISGTYPVVNWLVDGDEQPETGNSFSFNKPAGIYELAVVVEDSFGESYSGRYRVRVLEE